MTTKDIKIGQRYIGTYETGYSRREKGIGRVTAISEEKIVLKRWCIDGYKKTIVDIDKFMEEYSLVTDRETYRHWVGYIGYAMLIIYLIANFY